jgi:hypothetical protein
MSGQTETGSAIAAEVVAHAARIDNFSRTNMEARRTRRRRCPIVRELHRQPGNTGHVGAVIQAHLHRSERDVEELSAERIRIRLCKRAYKEPPEIAFQDKKRRPELREAHESHAQGRHVPRHRHARSEDDRRNDAFARAEKIPPARSASRCFTACAATCRNSWCATIGACACTSRSARSVSGPDAQTR